MTATIQLAELRSHLGTTINEATHAKKRTIITRNGTPAAAIVPIDDLNYIEELEDQLDALAMQKAREEDDGEDMSFEEYLESQNQS